MAVGWRIAAVDGRESGCEWRTAAVDGRLKAVDKQRENGQKMCPTT